MLKAQDQPKLPSPPKLRIKAPKACDFRVLILEVASLHISRTTKETENSGIVFSHVSLGLLTCGIHPGPNNLIESLNNLAALRTKVEIINISLNPLEFYYKRKNIIPKSNKDKHSAKLKH